MTGKHQLVFMEVHLPGLPVSGITIKIQLNYQGTSLDPPVPIALSCELMNGRTSCINCSLFITAFTSDTYKGRLFNAPRILMNFRTNFEKCALPIRTLQVIIDFLIGHRRVILCDKGGGILNFVTSHFKNSIKAILHVSIKLKQFH